MTTLTGWMRIRKGRSTHAVTIIGPEQPGWIRSVCGRKAGPITGWNADRRYPVCRYCNDLVTVARRVAQPGSSDRPQGTPVGHFANPAG